jgi:hypothetical protein
MVDTKNDVNDGSTFGNKTEIIELKASQYKNKD